MEYKEITIGQSNELVDMYIETFNSDPWNDNWTLDTAQKRLSQMINVEDFYGLAAYNEGELCGMILGSKEQFYDGVMFNIKEFCVRNGMRGQGVGTEIFREFEKRLKILGVKEIVLFTARGDYTEKFYNKHGLKSHDGLVLMGKDI